MSPPGVELCGGGVIRVPPPPSLPVVVQCFSAPILHWGVGACWLCCGFGVVGLCALCHTPGFGAGGKRGGGGRRGRMLYAPYRWGGGTPAALSRVGRPSSPHGLGLLRTYRAAAAAISPGCGVGGILSNPMAHTVPPNPPPPRARTPSSCRSSSPPACSPNLTLTAHPGLVSIALWQWGGWGGGAVSL